jgi:hypothetical protein
MNNIQNFYTKLIKPIRDDFILNIIKTADVDIYSPYDKDFTFNERIESISALKNNFIFWSRDFIKGLDKFPYCYVMNGNTDSINAIFSFYKDQWAWKKGDYIYYNHWHSAKGTNFKELDELGSIPNLIFTWPGYSFGNRNEIDFALKNNSLRKHLDCAYLGLVKPDCIDISDFETASFSFSKTLAIPYNRISLLFSKTEIPDLSIMNKIGYVNLSGARLANYLLENIPNDYYWNKYGCILDDLCTKFNLSKTDCILFAYHKGQRISLAEYWEKYKS